MATTITFADKTTLTLDAALSQGHERGADVTQHPVEQGADVSDYVRAKPHSLTVQGIIAKFPMVDPETEPEKNRVAKAFERLERAVDGGELVTVQTGLKVYRSMAIVGLSVTREARNGHDMEVRLDFREVRLATAKTVAVPKDAIGKAPPAATTAQAKAAQQKTKDQAAAQQARGQKQPSNLTPKQAAAAAKVQAASVPKSWLKLGLGGLLGG